MNSLKEYYENPALNQSKLKKLLGFNPKKFNEEQTDETQSMKIGNIVDCLITHPETFEDDFHIFNAKTPSDTIVSICKDYLEIAGDVEIEPFGCKTTLIQCARNAHYYDNKKDDALYETIVKTALEYYNELKMSSGKHVISQADLDLAARVVESIRSKFHNIITDNNIRFQVPLYGKYEDTDIKGLLDFIIINEDVKKIDIIDLKTSYDDTSMFIFNVHKYRYDIQMAWYRMLVQQNYPEYDIECYFLVESTSNIGSPILYHCSDNIIEIGMNGAVKNTGMLISPNIQGYYLIEGIKHLMDKLKYYEKNGFDVDMKISNNRNMFELDWFGAKGLML